MSDSLDYIKQTGVEIAELNHKINDLNEENKKLLREINDLNEEVIEKEKELESIRNVSNRWYWEYEDVCRENRKYKSQIDGLLKSLEIILPKFKGELCEDLDDGMFSEVLNAVNRRW